MCVLPRLANFFMDVFVAVGPRNIFEDKMKLFAVLLVASVSYGMSELYKSSIFSCNVLLVTTRLIVFV